MRQVTGNKLPEGDYNLTIRWQVQRRHSKGTLEYERYAQRLTTSGLKPSIMDAKVDVQGLVYEFHRQGIYEPNHKDGSPRESVDTKRVIGQYWDDVAARYVDTTWIMIVYSKRGTHVYPLFPREGAGNDIFR